MVCEHERLLDDPFSIGTRRLILDAPKHADIPAIVVMANNEKVARMTATMPHPYSGSDAQKWISAAGASDGVGAKFAVRLRKNGSFIGACGYGKMRCVDDIQLGYWIGEPYWGRGYATEAAHAVIDHAFGHGGIDRLHGCCRVINSGSRRIIAKCGFQFRDMSMIHSIAGGGMVPVERYVLERGVWESLKAWGDDR